uniref:Uncharacterized protein n=1 Tax=Arundo donax TaxID=35708 RepID=A0A0A9DRA4_ARUDO
MQLLGHASHKPIPNKILSHLSANISLRSRTKPWNRLTGSMTQQLNPPTATPFLDRKELHLHKHLLPSSTKSKHQEENSKNHTAPTQRNETRGINDASS